MFEYIHRKWLSAAILCGCFCAQIAIAQTPIQHDNSAAVHSGVASGVAAVVDGHAISIDEVEKIAIHKHGQEILDSLIDNYLIDREAARLHIEVSQADIDDQVQMLTEAIKPKTLEEGLQAHHETLAEIREDFRQRLLALKLAAMNVPPGHFVHADVILIKSDNAANPVDADALAQATAIQKQLLAGAKFDEMAKRYSQDPSSRTRGGDIGILFEGSPRDARVIQSALEMKANKISGKPVRTPSGYYLIMVSSTDAEHPADENQLYSDAKKQYELYQGSRNLPEYLQELRSKATIRRGGSAW